MILILDTFQTFNSIEDFVELNLDEVNKAISTIKKKKEIAKMKAERDELIKRANAIQKDIDGMLKFQNNVFKN